MRIRKKPTVTEAIPIRQLTDTKWSDPNLPYWAIQAKRNALVTFHGDAVVVKTPRGNKRGEQSDWIVCDEHNNLFVYTYEQLMDEYEEVG